MKNYINMDSFGSDCPTNWEEIADFLNDIIRKTGIEDDHDAVNDLWEQYCNGEVFAAPEAVYDEPEQKKTRKDGWHIVHSFDGRLDWEALNAAIAFDSGIDEPYCDTEEEYKQGIRDGWIRFENGKTNIYADGEYWG